jgi:hypothetical protein
VLLLFFSFCIKHAIEFGWASHIESLEDFIENNSKTGCK